jgi:hypothetical protein
VGCGVEKCPPSKSPFIGSYAKKYWALVVCQYDPTGNYNNLYKENVKKKKAKWARSAAKMVNATLAEEAFLVL